MQLNPYFLREPFRRIGATGDQCVCVCACVRIIRIITHKVNTQTASLVIAVANTHTHTRTRRQPSIIPHADVSQPTVSIRRRRPSNQVNRINTPRITHTPFRRCSRVPFVYKCRATSTAKNPRKPHSKPIDLTMQPRSATNKSNGRRFGHVLNSRSFCSIRSAHRTCRCTAPEFRCDTLIRILCRGMCAPINHQTIACLLSSIQ